MIKSKRRTLIYSRRMTKATWKLDKGINWVYEGYNKKLGDKFSSNNNVVCSCAYLINKGHRPGEDLIDT